MSLTCKLITDCSRHGVMYFTDLHILPGESSAVVRHQSGMMLQETQPQLKAVGHRGFLPGEAGTGRNALPTHSPSCATVSPGRGNVCSLCNPCHLWWANFGGCCDASVCSFGTGRRHV